MIVLGVHVGHDSGAALIVDGRIVADNQEERFTRVKHYAGLPVNSVATCLRQGGIGIEDVDAIAIPSAAEVRDLNFLFDLKGQRSQRRSRLGRAEDVVREKTGRAMRKPPLYFRSFPLSSSTEIVNVDHHRAHAASAYFTSGTQEKQLVVVIDGTGDATSVSLWRGQAGTLELLKRFDTTASLGWFYSNVTEALGWWHGDGEGKTMGLAPYGTASAAHGLLDGFYPRFSAGDLVEPHHFGSVFVWNEVGAEEWHFDEANQIAGLLNKCRREDLAAEAQRILEEQTAQIIEPWLAREDVDRLSCAGGVFLNVKMNQRIWATGRLSQHHIFPNPGDAGLSVGAALSVYHEHCPTAPVGSLADVYWGPEYDNEEIKDLLNERNLPMNFVADVADAAGSLLADNKIVALFQGRMESGPRALGDRSILMSPLRADNKDIINARVKFREAFRPFCPSLLSEKTDIYLSNARSEPFMITSFDVTDEKRDAIPAVVHVDGTVRPQTLEREVNPAYWDVIKSFGDITGEYVLLNTSLNIRGEPVICHPREAIRAFYDTGLDHLFLGNYMLSKEDTR